MRILLSVTNLQIGGAQMFVLQLAYALQKKGHKVLLYSHYGDYDKLNFPEVKIISLSRYKFINRFIWFLNGFLSKIFYIKNFREKINNLFFVMICKKFKPDVINSHMSQSDVIISKLIKKKKIKTKFIPTLHGEYEMGLVNDNDLINLLKTTDAIVFTTHKNITRFQNNEIKMYEIGIGLSKELIQYYIKNIVRKNLNIDSNDFVFGMIARGIPEKGWESLIKSFIEINQQHSNTSLLLIGDGNYLNELFKKYSHHKIVLKQLDNNPMEFFSYIPIIDVGVLPTYFSGESYPNILIQYIYFEKPVISTDIGAIKEIVCGDNLNCGIVLPLHDYKINDYELKEAMIKMITDKELYKKFKTNCTIKRDKFEINNIASKYEEVFNYVINS
jgi:glycosyltransferase involved in cell wall biosynthesis